MKMGWKEALKQAGGIKEFVVPLLVAVWMIYQFVGSYSLKQSNFDALGSDGYARMISGMGLFFVAIYLVMKLVQIARLASAAPEGKPSHDRSAAADSSSGKKTAEHSLLATLRVHYKVTMLALCILYVAVMDKIGFIVSTAIYLLVSMLLFSDKKRKIWLIVLLSAIFSVGLYYMFRYGFRIILP